MNWDHVISTLRSADPLAAPVLVAGYLSEPADLDVPVEGLRLTLDIAPPGAARPAQLRALPAPRADDTASSRAHVRARAETTYHPTGTAAMGASEQAVCDPQLRVRGVSRLRVVDAPVLPDVPRGSTNAPVIMFAEKAVDLIREVPRPPAQRVQEPDRART